MDPFICGIPGARWEASIHRRESVKTRDSGLLSVVRGGSGHRYLVCAGGVRFAIADLDDLWERSGHIQQARRAAIEVIVAEALLVLTVVGVITAVRGSSTFMYGLARLDLGLAFALVGASAFRWPRPVELWASYRGERLIIYSGTDPVEFGKVARAAERAVNHYRDVED
jgi:hypothetical protein